MSISKVLLIVLATVTAINCSIAQTPENVANLELWLRSDSNITLSNGKITEWESIVNNFSATNSLISRRPSYGENVFTEQEGVIIGGSQAGPFLTVNPSQLGDDFTLYFFMKMNGFDNAVQYFLGLYPSGRGFGFTNSNKKLVYVSGGVQLQSSNAFVGDQFYLVKVKYDHSVHNMSIDANFENIVTGAIPEITLIDSLCIGSRGDQNWSFNGSIAEFAWFSNHLTLDEEVEMELYFRNHYAPELDLPDTIQVNNFCDTLFNASKRYVSYNWSNGSDSSTTILEKDGYLILEVETVFGDVFVDSLYVKFPGNFINSFNLCTTSDSLYSTNLDSFDVTWQDGSTEPNYLITQGGEYSLTVTDSEGCTYESDTVFVTEDFFPTEVELIENPNFCTGNELYLSSGFAEAEEYEWNTGATSAFIQPSSSGEYWVEATNANGCVGRDTIVVDIVGNAPLVEFITGTACASNAVVFTDDTYDEGSTITDQNWLFDGEPATGAVVETTFAEAGLYPVELTVTLANGCSGIGRDTIEVSPLPLVSFNFDEVIPCAGNAVSYESMSGVPGDGEIADYAWIFGNGSTDDGLVGTTVFNEQGVNTVQLAVTTTMGCVDSLLSNVVVLGSPVVEFTFDTVCVGMPTVFNEAVDVSESGPVFYNWQFGDGFFSNFPNTSHVYASAGVYNVQLTATGNDFGGAGCVDQLVKQVRVYDAPVGSMAATDGCLGAGVEFTDLTEPVTQGGVADYIASRQWVLPFGYGQGPIAVGSDSVQVWNAAEAGNYLVELDFVTAAGCVGSASANVDVLAIPEASFILEIPPLEPPFSVSPVNTSVDTDQFVWLMNGEVVSTAVTPLLVFPDTGNYEISLVATNELGCNDTTTQFVEVIDPVWDLALVDIRYAVVGNRLALRAVLGNNGNVEINSFEMSVQLGLSTNTDQEMEFAIAPGEVKEFVLPQDFEYLPSRDLPYVCMEVAMTSQGVVEVDTENNDLCIGLEQEKAVFIDPYPNPTFNVVKLGFVLPVGGDVGIRVSDSSGREMASFVWSLGKGYSLREFDFSGFSEGVYFVRYSFLGEEVVKRVVVVE